MIEKWWCFFTLELWNQIYETVDSVKSIYWSLKLTPKSSRLAQLFTFIISYWLICLNLAILNFLLSFMLCSFIFLMSQSFYLLPVTFFCKALSVTLCFLCQRYISLGSASSQCSRGFISPYIKNTQNSGHKIIQTISGTFTNSIFYMGNIQYMHINLKGSLLATELKILTSEDHLPKGFSLSSFPVLS